MNVISCSRRTDIPHFYPDWLEEKLAGGSISFKSPRGLPRTVSLLPANVHSIVLWSKDFGPLLGTRGLTARLHLLSPYFHFTITGLGGSAWEPGIPAWQDSLAQMAWLVEKFGPERVNWRFDPVLSWKEGEKVMTNLNLFSHLGERVADLGVKTCTFSFAQWYRKSQRRAEKNGLCFVEPGPEEKLAAATTLAELAAGMNMRLSSCSNEAWEAVSGIGKARCIDGNLLAKLRPDGVMPSLAKDGSQRRECGCTRSIDIGSYTQRCGGEHCVYCYAN